MAARMSATSGDATSNSAISSTSDGRRVGQRQFACDRDEILLEHLQGHNSGSGAAMFCDEIEGASLFGGSGLVVGVDEDVGVEEATCAHYRRASFVRLCLACLCSVRAWISSRLKRQPRESPLPDRRLNSSMLPSTSSP